MLCSMEQKKTLMIIAHVLRSGSMLHLTGYSYVHLYDGSRNISQKSISFSGRVKTVKIIGDKVKVVYDNGREKQRI